MKNLLILISICFYNYSIAQEWVSDFWASSSNAKTSKQIFSQYEELKLNYIFENYLYNDPQTDSIHQLNIKSVTVGYSGLSYINQPQQEKTWFDKNGYVQNTYNTGSYYKYHELRKYDEKHRLISCSDTVGGTVTVDTFLYHENGNLICHKKYHFSKNSKMNFNPNLWI